ncbi:hypothetical protein EON67_08645 [archaeon]|nr:MAG: hypothetical protein EON67_08645 [archaeon]
MQAEQFVSTSILRPGLLNRGDEARWVEKMAMYVMPSIPVQTVARAMVADAKAHLQAAGAGGGGAGASPLVTELSNKDLFALSG